MAEIVAGTKDYPYTVVYGYQDDETMEDFILKVNEKRDEGWEPFGGLTAVVVPGKGLCVAQAMMHT